MTFTLGKIHRLNILAGHEVSDSGGDGLKASGTYFPANFTKENAFAMINQYDSTKGSGGFLFKCFYAEPYPFFLWSFEL